jgi:tetratricopeptide (TPR) repeat protein
MAIHGRPARKAPQPSSRGRILLAIVLVVVAIGLGTFSWWSSRQAARARASARSQPAQRAPRPGSLTPVEFDLASPTSGEPIRLRVAARQRFELSLANRAPAASYAWSLQSPVFTSPELVIRDMAGESRRGRSPAAACPAVEEAWRTYLETFDEDAASPRLEELRAALKGARQSDDAACRAAGGGMTDYFISSMSRLKVAGGVGLAPGGGARFVIRKRDPATGAAVRSWTIVVEAPAREPGWRYVNEQAWLVVATVRDMAALALSANGKVPSALVVRVTGSPTPHEVVIEAGGRQVVSGVPLDFAAPVWAPSAYAAVARALVGPPPGRDPARAAEAAQLLETLLDAGTETLMRESRAVSERLARSPLDPDVHDQAALLVAAFALSEAAGPLSDVRRELCALTAHLALASALSAEGAPSPARVVATAALETLAKREKPALELVQRFPPTPAASRPALDAWARALRLRVTRDWRVMAKAAGATPLERREHMRAVVASLGEKEGATLLEDARQAPEPWALRVLAVDWVSVGTGSLLSALLPAVEIAEAEATLGLSSPGQGGLARISQAITQAPRERFEEKQPIGVLSRSMWAARAQRQLANAIRIVYHHFWNSGQPEGDREFRQRMAAFEALPLFRAVQQNAQARTRRDAAKRKMVADEETRRCAAIAGEMQRAPEPITAGMWDDLVSDCSGLALSGKLPLWSQWFSPAVPRGTAYDAERRLRARDVDERYSTEEIEALRALVVFEPMVFNLSVKRRFGREPNGADFAREYARVAEYDRTALQVWAHAEGDNDARRLPIERRLCEMLADDCLDYGRALLEAGREDEAARAYQRAVDRARDSVAVSNRVRWLANYYLDHGSTARAIKVARVAADAYSWAGLETLGHVQERLGDLEAAEQTYKAILERYQTSSSLDAFYIRRQRRDGGGRYVAEAEAARKNLFPMGFAQVVHADLVAESRRPGYAARVVGVRVDEARLDRELRRLGLREGDVIVAVDGIRVQNDEQYRCVLSLTDAARTRFDVWRDGAYIELEGRKLRLSYAPVKR